MRGRGVRKADDMDQSEIALGLLASHLLTDVLDDVVADVLGEHSRREDTGMRQIFFERKIQSRGSRWLEIRIAGGDVTSRVHDRGGGNLLEAGSCDSRGEGGAGQKVRRDFIASL